MLCCGFDLFALVSDETTRCRFATHGDLLAKVCRQIEDHGLRRCKVPPPPRQPFQCQHASAVGQERSEACAELQDDIQWLCPPGRGPDEKSFIDRVHTTPANRARRLEFDTMVKGANAQAVIGPTGPMCQQGPLQAATVTGSCEQPPVIDPCEPGKNMGYADLQTPLEGLRNAYATIKHRPIVRADQKTPSWRWRQSGRTCMASQTGSPATRQHRQARKPRPPKPLCPISGQ